MTGSRPLTTFQDTIILGPTSPVKVESHSQLLGSKETLPRSKHEYNNFCTGLLTNPGQDYFAFEKHQPGMLKESTVADIEREYPDDWPTFSYIALTTHSYHSGMAKITSACLRHS